MVRRPRYHRCSPPLAAIRREEWRVKHLKSTVVGVCLLVWVLTAVAVDLRGRVDSQNRYARYPFALTHVALDLWVLDSEGWRKVASTANDAQGTYYFSGQRPGKYMLQVHGQNFPITVNNVRFQNITPILVRR